MIEIHSPHIDQMQLDLDTGKGTPQVPIWNGTGGLVRPCDVSRLFLAEFPAFRHQRVRICTSRTDTTISSLQRVSTSPIFSHLRTNVNRWNWTQSYGDRSEVEADYWALHPGAPQSAPFQREHILVLYASSIFTTNPPLIFAAVQTVGHADLFQDSQGNW